MTLSHAIRRTALAAALTTAALTLAAPAAPAAHALPPTADERTLTIPMVDPETLAVCNVSVTPAGGLHAVAGGVYEGGAIHVSSPRSCGTVTWTVRFTVIDQSPTHATHAKSATAKGNPAYAAASQTVAYGIGQREVGVITLQWEWSSRLGSYCFQDVWTMSAAGMTPTWSSVSPECS